ncbi:MAG TPA: hypothetical protein VFI46_17980 [Jiangellaceae bacterium]|nr:hypothetical protein [Jiangellaceae bacterium]
MQRDLLLIGEMIEAAAQIQALAKDVHSAADLETDTLCRDALLWNYTVLGDAAAQLYRLYGRHTLTLRGTRPADLRNRIVHGGRHHRDGLDTVRCDRLGQVAHSVRGG